jgi:NAD(P)-dependent dehydrogenase (short-subunit alcohol dehydrogenase family)
MTTISDQVVLDGRRAVVTGAADGIGRSFANALFGAGAQVALLDVDPKVEDVAQSLDPSGLRAFAYRCDLTDPAAISETIDDAAAKMTGIDLLVSNAAVTRRTLPRKDDFDKALRDFDELIAVNLRAVYLAGRAVIPYLVANGGGDIVNVTTDHVHTCGYPVHVDHSDAQDCPWAGAPPRPPLGGTGDFDVYDASKWGVKGLTLSWARSLHRQNIRVNSFGMGATDTPMLRRMMGGELPTPVMAPDQVAGVLVDLVAEGDGGRTGDSVELWAGHPVTLPAPALDGRVLMGSIPTRT